jgi:hypothetical protein
VPASISFIGDVEAMDSDGTTAAILVPIAGNHTVSLQLDSGALLGTYPLTVNASATYAPSSVLEASTNFRLQAECQCCLLRHAIDLLKLHSAASRSGTACCSALLHSSQNTSCAYTRFTQLLSSCTSAAVVSCLTVQ